MPSRYTLFLVSHSAVVHFFVTSRSESYWVIREKTRFSFTISFMYGSRREVLQGMKESQQLSQQVISREHCTSLSHWNAHCSTQIRAIGHVRLVETLSRLYCLGVIRQNAILQYVAIHYAYADSKLIRVTLVSIEWRLFHKQIVGQNDTEEG